MRWKGYMQKRSPVAIEIALYRNEVPFSCQETYEPWGRDGRPVAPEKCTEERACFKPFVPKKTNT